MPHHSFGPPAGGVLEAAGGQTHDGAGVVGVRARQLHEGGGHHVRHVAHHGHGGVMLLAAQRHHAGVEAGHQLVQVLEVLGHGGLVGAEDPVRALEQIGAGDAALLGAGHGMARHVARRRGQKLGGRGEDVAFGGDGVGDDAGIAPVAQAGEVVVHSGHRRGDDHELTIVFDESAEGGVVGA